MHICIGFNREAIINLECVIIQVHVLNNAFNSSANMAVLWISFILVIPSSRLPTSISSKRSKDEVFRGPQSLPSFRQQKNGHPIS